MAVSLLASRVFVAIQDLSSGKATTVYLHERRQDPALRAWRDMECDEPHGERRGAAQHKIRRAVVPLRRTARYGPRMTTDGTRFLDEVWREGLLHLTAIPLQGRLRGRCFEHGAIGEAIAWAGRQNRDTNIYYTVNAPAACSDAAKLEKADIGWIRGIWADLDPNKRVEVEEPTEQEPKSGRQRERERLDQIAERLTECDCPPTLIVDSGNGIQAIWLLAEPVEANEANAGRAEAIGAAIERALGGTENTSNIDRVLRLPGFINRPTGKKRKLGRVEQPARLVHVGDRRYAWDELGELRATIERDVAPELIKAALLPKPEPKLDNGPQILSRASDPSLPEAIKVLLKRDRRLRQRWANGKKLTGGTDHS